MLFVDFYVFIFYFCLSSMFILYVNLICLSYRLAFWFPQMLFQDAWPFWSPCFLYSLVSLTTFGQHRLRLADSALYRLGFFPACFSFLGLFWDMQEYCSTSISYQRYCMEYIVMIDKNYQLQKYVPISTMLYYMYRYNRKWIGSKNWIKDTEILQDLDAKNLPEK